MKQSSIIGVVSFSLLLSGVGCTGRMAPPTYINIPQQAGDVAFGNPNAKNVRQIMTLAVQKALEAEPLGGPYELLLPAGTSPATYALVTHALGGDALVPGNVPAIAVDEDGKFVVPEGEPDPADVVAQPMLLGEFPTVEVRAIRVRSAKGEVDVVRPSNTGRNLQEVMLEWEAGFGWYAKRVRPWRIDPDAQPRPVGPVNSTIPTEPEPTPANAS